jgi:hypothetical protein
LVFPQPEDCVNEGGKEEGRERGKRVGREGA